MKLNKLSFKDWQKWHLQITLSRKDYVQSGPQYLLPNFNVIIYWVLFQSGARNINSQILIKQNHFISIVLHCPYVSIFCKAVLKYIISKATNKYWANESPRREMCIIFSSLHICPIRLSWNAQIWQKYWPILECVDVYWVTSYLIWYKRECTNVKFHIRYNNYRLKHRTV